MTATEELRRLLTEAGVEWQAYEHNEMLRLARENAKLRELARKLYSGYMGGHYVVSCEGCEHAYEDYGGYVPLDSDYCVFSDSDRYVGCWKQKRLEAEMRELGVRAK